MTLAATQEQAVLARRKEIEDKRRFKLHDKSYKVGVDTAALSSQIADKQASRLEEAASDAAFDEMRLNVDKHLMYVDQQRDAYLRERDVAVDEFRRTQQKKGESRDADLNDPDALKKDRAPVGDDISVSSFQKFAGEDTHYAERVRLQQAQLREWAAAQAAEKRQKAEAERQTDAMWANHMLEADLMRCEYAEKEGHIYRQRVAELAENNLAQLEFKRALQKEEDLRAEMDNATEIQAQLNSSWLGEDPNLTRSFLHPHRCAHRLSEAREPRRARPASLSRLRPRCPLPAPSARCRRARPDHFKGYTAEQKQAVVLELAQQVEARKAAEAEERELDKRVDDMTMHWNRIATLREHEVGASGRLARSAAARPALPLPPALTPPLFAARRVALLRRWRRGVPRCASSSRRRTRRRPRRARRITRRSMERSTPTRWTTTSSRRTARRRADPRSSGGRAFWRALARPSTAINSTIPQTVTQWPVAQGQVLRSWCVVTSNQGRPEQRQAIHKILALPRGAGSGSSLVVTDGPASCSPGGDSVTLSVSCSLRVWRSRRRSWSALTSCSVASRSLLVLASISDRCRSAAWCACSSLCARLSSSWRVVRTSGRDSAPPSCSQVSSICSTAGRQPVLSSSACTPFARSRRATFGFVGLRRLYLLSSGALEMFANTFSSVRIVAMLDCASKCLRSLMTSRQRRTSRTLSSLSESSDPSAIILLRPAAHQCRLCRPRTTTLVTVATLKGESWV